MDFLPSPPGWPVRDRRSAQTPIREITMAKKPSKKKRGKGSCPDTPKEFFTQVHRSFVDWVLWSSEIDACWESTCGTDEAKRELDRLCRALVRWWKDAKEWADEVEDCFQSQCSQPPDHTTPPDPPFGS